MFGRASDIHARSLHITPGDLLIKKSKMLGDYLFFLVFYSLHDYSNHLAVTAFKVLDAAFDLPLRSDHGGRTRGLILAISTDKNKIAGKIKCIVI